MTSSESRPGVPAWLYLCVLMVGALSIVSLYFRHRVEDGNRTVAIAGEIDAVQSLAAAQGLTVDQGLAELKKDGLTAVVVPEEHVADLFTQGGLWLVDGKYVEGSSEAMQRLLRGVRMRFPGLISDRDFAASSGNVTGIRFSDLNLVRGVAVGLSPTLASAAERNGLVIIARCLNPPSATSKTVDQTLGWARELGAAVFLPEGVQVLGRRDSLDAFIESIRSHDMYYASPEFAKIGGDQEVVEKMPDRVIRLHSALGEELDKMSVADAVDRYAKAARERNQRILLLRPLSPAADQPLADFGSFVNQVRAETEHEGGVIGKPHPFSEPPDHGLLLPLFLFIALFTVPIAVWVASAFVSQRWFAVFILVVSLLLVAACLKPAGRTVEALLVAITFPTAAFLTLDRRDLKSWPIEYVLITLISLVGGLAVAGLLNGLLYYVQAKQFLGVKFAHFFPIALVGGYFFYRFGIARKSLASPLEWGKALLGLVILGSLAFMISRTGNDNPAGVSETELKLRAILDAVLFVRPRTKEFLIGHPFLILGIIMLASQRRGDPQFQNWKGWITLFIMLGAIGQTSIVNTMCHIHTPLTISLARIGVGFVLGGILGAAVWGVLRHVGGKFHPAEGR